MIHVIDDDGKRTAKAISYIRTVDGRRYGPPPSKSISEPWVAIQEPEAATSVAFPLLGRTGTPAFMLHPDGRIDANWHELMAMKNEYLAGTAPQYAWAAALWLARNTR